MTSQNTLPPHWPDRMTSLRTATIHWSESMTALKRLEGTVKINKMKDNLTAIQCSTRADNALSLSIPVLLTPSPSLFPNLAPSLLPHYNESTSFFDHYSVTSRHLPTIRFVKANWHLSTAVAVLLLVEKVGLGEGEGV